MNARVSNPFQLPAYLAEELGEAELAEPGGSEPEMSVHARAVVRQRCAAGGTPVLRGHAGRKWRLRNSRRAVCGSAIRRVALKNIRCPVLNISAERDSVVPPQESASFIEHVGTSEANNLVFPSGHLGLMVSRAAHERLWPYVGTWLRGAPADRGRQHYRTSPRNPVAPFSRRPEFSVSAAREHRMVDSEALHADGDRRMLCNLRMCVVYFAFT